VPRSASDDVSRDHFSKSHEGAFGPITTEFNRIRKTKENYMKVPETPNQMQAGKIQGEQKMTISKWATKAAGILVLCLAVSATASAQYGGGSGSGGSGTSGTGSTGSTAGYGSGPGKAIGIGVGVGAAAAVGIALLVHHHHAAAHSQASVIGCTESLLGGLSLNNENDNQTYMIIPGSTSVQAGDRVELKGVVADDGSGNHAFRVQSLVKNYGTCGPASVGTRVAQNTN
jgi:hypothetical protein